MATENPANSYYWAVLMKEIAAHKGWPESTAHDWVKVTWAIKTTQGYTRQESIRLIKLVKEHVEKHWGIQISNPPSFSSFPHKDEEWEAYCRSLASDVI